MLCTKCHERFAEHQLYHQNADGSRVPSNKLCHECYVNWFLFAELKPSFGGKKRHKDREWWCVIVGEAEVRLCGFDYLGMWVASGYRVYGMATGKDDIHKLFQMAVQEVGV